MEREKQSSTKKQKHSSTKKPSAADFLSSPPQPPPKAASAAETSRRKSVSEKPNALPKTVSSIAELKEVASSRLESIKRMTETTHSDILNDVDSSNSLLHKRLKVQTQACQKLMDDTDKEFKKMLERISESSEAMKASYSEFHVQGETSYSRVRKTTVPEKVQFFENAIDALRNRYATFSSA